MEGRQKIEKSQKMSRDSGKIIKLRRKLQICKKSNNIEGNRKIKTIQRKSEKLQNVEESR